MKCSETLPNIVLGLTGCIGGVSGKTFVISSKPRNSAFSPESMIFCGKVLQKTGNTPKHFFGLTDYNGCVRDKTFSESSVPRNSAFSSEQKLFMIFHAEGLLNAPKHSQTSFEV